ncbi:hypothetical protein DAI22_06g138500 [Oryza sativa Japonica Group]|nr:hypothetical protein DAI22_06g138500 [Oryza sativa Japonica Group]
MRGCIGFQSPAKGNNPESRPTPNEADQVFPWAVLHGHVIHPVSQVRSRIAMPHAAVTRRHTPGNPVGPPYPAAHRRGRGDTRGPCVRQPTAQISPHSARHAAASA